MANLNEMDKWQIAQEAIKKLNALPKVPGGVDPAVIAKPVADYLPFRFENPLPAMQKSYNEAGGGAAGVGALLGNRLKAGVEGAVDMARPDTEPGLISGFKQGFGTVAAPVANTRPVETQTQTPVGLPIGGGITVTEANTSNRAGFSPRTYRDASGNVVASGISGVVGRGGFVGAATDAEAARNLQARAEQDTAARGMAANFDRQTEALRNARAEKLGISREVLDASEGRGVVKGTPVETAPNPFAMPGDNFGDDIRRRNELLSTINDPNARKTDRTAALSTFQSFMSQPQQVKVQPQSQGNLLDANKFLLDREKFLWQQGIDKNRAAIDELEAQSKVAGAKLQQQKYNDEQRQAFINDFSYPAEGAPHAQLGELAWNLSKATGGQLSPQEATLYIQKAAEKNGVDWKDAQPESITALGQEAMKLAKQDRMQK